MKNLISKLVCFSPTFVALTGALAAMMPLLVCKAATIFLGFSISPATVPQKLLHIATTWSMRLKANQDKLHKAPKSPNKLGVRQRVKPYFIIGQWFSASPTRCYACRQKEAASRWSISHSLSLCNAARHLHSIRLTILGKPRTTKENRGIFGYSPNGLWQPPPSPLFKENMIHISSKSCLWGCFDVYLISPSLP